MVAVLNGPKRPLYGAAGGCGHDSPTPPLPMRWARCRRYNRRDPADNRVMDKHFHVWLRSGTVFVLKAKPYKSRAHANKVAAEMRTNPDDRMVRACEQCPTTTPSKRRPPRSE